MDRILAANSTFPCPLCEDVMDMQGLTVHMEDCAPPLPFNGLSSVHEHKVEKYLLDLELSHDGRDHVVLQPAEEGIPQFISNWWTLDHGSGDLWLPCHAKVFW